jgi:hypothetical protein
VTKQELWENLMVLRPLRGIKDTTVLEMFLEKHVRSAAPNASQEEREKLKSFWREKLRLEQLNEATVRAEAALRRLDGAQAQQTAVTAHSAVELPSAEGDFALLRNKKWVNFDVAVRYLGITRRAVEKAAKKGSLTRAGRGPHRRISVDSLLNYSRPEKNAN